jgi:hypothetical protein
MMKQMADPDRIWRVQRAKLLLRFSHLAEEDFRYDYGMKDVMMTKLQAKLGKSRDELNRLLLAL